MHKKSLRLTRANAGLVVVDVQERLLPAIFEQPRVVQDTVRLIQGAAMLRVPIFATEQYRKGLGPTVPEVAAAIPGFAPMEKLAFSACGAAGFIPALKEKKVSEPILCGIEAHVCVKPAPRSTRWPPIAWQTYTAESRLSSMSFSQPDSRRSRNAAMKFDPPALFKIGRAHV